MTPYDPTKPPHVRGVWKSDTEHVKFDTDNGLIILPEGPDAHRLYFAGSPTQLAQMLAVVYAFAEQLPAEVLRLAERVERDNRGTGEWRDGPNGPVWRTPL